MTTFIRQQIERLVAQRVGLLGRAVPSIPPVVEHAHLLALLGRAPVPSELRAWQDEWALYTTPGTRPRPVAAPTATSSPATSKAERRAALLAEAERKVAAEPPPLTPDQLARLEAAAALDPAEKARKAAEEREAAHDIARAANARRRR